MASFFASALCLAAVDEDEVAPEREHEKQHPWIGQHARAEGVEHPNRVLWRHGRRLCVIARLAAEMRATRRARIYFIVPHF
jgi:hypothetical protein